MNKLNNKKVIVILISSIICTCLLYIILFDVINKSQQDFDNKTPQCGHWAILRSCEFLGVPIEMVNVLNLLSIKKQGNSMYELLKVFDKIGLLAEGKKETLEGVADKEIYPCIAYVDNNHFIVIVNIEKNNVYFYDGDGRRSISTINEFKNRWTNKILVVSRDSNYGVLPAYLLRKPDITPCIQFDTLLIDKGEVPDVGENIEFVFPFSNLGKSNLIIEKIITDCGCVESSKSSEMIPPGGRGQISLKYNINSGSGEFSHEAIVKTNDPLVPLIKLTACGNTDRAITVEPQNLNIGRIVSGGTKVTYCHVTYTGDIPLEVLNVEFLGEQIDLNWRVLDKELLKDIVPANNGKIAFVSNNMHSLEVTLIPQSGYTGEIDGSLCIYTNIKDFEKISVHLQTEIVQQVILSPAILYLGCEKTAEEIKQTITAWSTNDITFKIAGVDTADTGFEALYSNETANKTDITFTGKVNRLIDVANRDINVFIELPGKKELLSIKLPVYISSLTKNL